MDNLIFLKDELETLTFGAHFARECAFEKQTICFLKGDLGAGKTTFVRGFLRALGYEGLVKSPSYTLVETYALNGKNIFHFDLYRLKNPSELALIGLHDYLGETGVFFFEWPENGEGFLPEADVVLSFSVVGEGRLVERGSLSPACAGDNH